MKVLSTGKTSWSGEFECCECHAKLEVVKSDLHVGNNAVAYAGDSWDPYVYFNCAVCKSRNTVTGKIPSGISETLISKARSDRFSNRLDSYWDHY
jgi:hypothetical protein